MHLKAEAFENNERETTTFAWKVLQKMALENLVMLAVLLSCLIALQQITCGWYHAETCSAFPCKHAENGHKNAIKSLRIWLIRPRVNVALEGFDFGVWFPVVYLKLYEYLFWNSLNLSVWNANCKFDVYQTMQEFNPLRFQSDEMSKRHPYAYIPFSAGVR